MSIRRFLPKILLLLALAALAAALVWRFTRDTSTAQQDAAYAALTAGDIDPALALARRWEIAGRTEDAILLRAEIELRQGQAEAALRTLQQLRDDSDKVARAAILQGRALLALRDLPQAERAFAFAQSRLPDDPDVNLGLAALQYDLGNLQSALALVRQVTSVRPNDALSWRFIGVILKDLPDGAKDAIPAYREALRLGLPPTADLDARLDLAECLIKENEFAAVEPLLAGATIPPEKRSLAAAYRAEAFVGHGRVDEGRRILDAALADSPRDVELLSRRGFLALQTADAAGAVTHLRRAYDNGGVTVKIAHQLAVALAQVGEAEPAKLMEARAKELETLYLRLSKLTEEAGQQPWDAGLRRQIADICDQIRRPELAAMWREAAAACDKRAGGR